MNNKDFDHVFKDIDKVFAEFDKIMKQADQTFREASKIGVDEFNARATWQPYKSLVPIKIGKKWYWNSPVFRKYVLESGSPGHWVYGTEFDVLKDSK